MIRPARSLVATSNGPHQELSAFSRPAPPRFTLAGSMPSCCNTEVNQCGVDLSQVNIDLGDIGALIGLTEPLSLDVGVGCLPLTETEAVTSSGIQIVSNVDTMNPTPCGNVADAGP